jgi:hypothetical protein
MSKELSEVKKIYRVIADKGRPRHPKSWILLYGMIGAWLLVGFIVLVIGALSLGYRFPPFIR